MAGVLYSVPSLQREGTYDCKSYDLPKTYDFLRLEREVILHLGNVVSCSYNKTDCWEGFFFCCLYYGKSSQRLQFPSLSMACNAFISQRAMRSLPSLLLEHKSYYTPGSWFYNYVLSIYTPLKRIRIQAQRDNITMDYILPILYTLQHPKLNFLASGLCR